MDLLADKPQTWRGTWENFVTRPVPTVVPIVSGIIVILAFLYSFFR